MNQTEQQLTARLLDTATRETAFRELAYHYGKSLYWHIRRIVVGHDDAEDVLQNAFISIYRHINSIKDATRLRPWLYSIATREALQLLRKQTCVFQSIDTLDATLEDRLVTESHIDPESMEVLLQKAILQLPTKQRITFNMRYFDEMSYDEISQATGISVASLKTNYHYAVVKIKQYLKENS